MSEPQHPQPQDTDTNEGRPASVARAVVQPVGQPGLDSLAAVGARLTQLRESKNWSIEDVSARLKVAPAKLRALEAGDISHLPDTTFALGVVRSYAKMLGADPTPFTQALRREKGVPAPDLSMPASSGKDLPRGRVSLSLGGGAQRSRSWLWGVAAVIVAMDAQGSRATGHSQPGPGEIDQQFVREPDQEEHPGEQQQFVLDERQPFERLPCPQRHPIAPLTFDRGSYLVCMKRQCVRK